MFPTEHSSSSSSNGDTRKQISIDGQTFALTLLTAQSSAEKNQNLCQAGQAFVLLYAINDKSSLAHIRQQHKQLREAKGSRLSIVPVFLVGTKSDLEADRQVSLEEARQLAVELRCQKLFEISTLKHTEEINDLFTKLVRQHLTFRQAAMTTRPPMTPVSSTSRTIPSSPVSPSIDESPRRPSSVFERIKFGTLKRKASISSLMRKKSGSFSESIMSLGSARPSRDNLRSISYGASSTLSDVNSNGGRGPYGHATLPRRSTTGSPYRLDVNTSAWRDTVKWPTDMIPEEELLVN